MLERGVKHWPFDLLRDFSDSRATGASLGTEGTPLGEDPEQHRNGRLAHSGINAKGSCKVVGRVTFLRATGNVQKGLRRCSRRHPCEAKTTQSELPMESF